MIDLEPYLNIIDTNFITYIIIFSSGCIIFNFIVSLIYNSVNRNNNKNLEENNEDNFNMIDLLGSLLLILIIIFLIPVFVKINKFISFLYIPSIILLFYIVYIKPMYYDRAFDFKFDYYEYGAVITFSLFFFSTSDFKNSFISITSVGTLQVICIFILLLEIYCSFYCFLLNLYFVIKNLKKINIDFFVEKYQRFIKNVNKKFDYSNIILRFDNTYKLTYDKNVVKFKRILLFFPYLLLDSLVCFFKYVVSLFFSLILKPFFIILNYILLKIVKLSNTNENQINYSLTKIVWTLSIILVYIILQMNTIFQNRIINTYEFISSVIIIPIILDSLLSFKEKIKSKIMTNS